MKCGDFYGRGGEIRTPDPLFPKQMRYQAALRPGPWGLIRRLFAGDKSKFQLMGQGSAALLPKLGC